MKSFEYVVENARTLFPGAHSQAESLDELRSNMKEVIELLLIDGEPKLEAEFRGHRKIKLPFLD